MTGFGANEPPFGGSDGRDDDGAFGDWPAGDSNLDNDGDAADSGDDPWPGLQDEASDCASCAAGGECSGTPDKDCGDDWPLGSGDDFDSDGAADGFMPNPNGSASDRATSLKGPSDDAVDFVPAWNSDVSAGSEVDSSSQHGSQFRLVAPPDEVTGKPDSHDEAAADATMEVVTHADEYTEAELEQALEDIEDQFDPEYSGTNDEFGPCGWLPHNECGYFRPGDPRSVDDVKPRNINLIFTPLLVDTATGDATWALDFGSDDPCNEDVIRTAFGMLAENPGLVDWAMCMATENDNAGDCVKDHTKRTGPDLTMALVSDCSFGGGNFKIYTHGSTMDWCDNNGAFLDAAAQIWCDPLSTEGDRACAIVRVAASILHELNHVCLRDPFGSNVPFFPDLEHVSGECDVSYLAGNYALWALLQRYPAAAQSGCCTDVTGRGEMNDTFIPGLDPTLC